MKDIVFISGLSGAGGSYLAEYLVEEQPQVEVHGTTRWHSTTSLHNLKDIKDKVTIHECDLMDLSSLIRILRKIEPTKIFNMASHANVKVCFDNPLSVLNNNIMCTANLLEAVRLECPDVIFNQCSSSEVYGNPLDTPITENHPLNPVNPYAVSKLAQEKLCYAYYESYGLKVIITRMFAYICPRRVEIFSTAFARQAIQVEMGRKEFLSHGNLESIRTLIDVRDAMRSYWVACEYCKYGEPYNIGGNEVITVGEFLDHLCKQSKVPIKCVQNPDLMRPIDVTRQIVDISKFEKATNGTWKQRYSLSESVEWLLQQVRKEEGYCK